MSSTTGQAVKLPSLTSASLTSAQRCFRFSLAEIQSATKDFNDELVIGQGGFGKVYKGSICIEETSHVVAIKRLDSTSNQEAPEFRAEIEMLSKLRHCHLVSLIGYCDDNMEMILIYEYMPHGTLYHHLHKAETPLSWVQRLKIAIGAGRGLDYLHTGFGTQQGVIHRDVKSSNILLDENWAAMISDFGLSKIGLTNQSSSYVEASIKGTFGYLDPEYVYTTKLTRKTDVYAFGVVLFELLSGRLAVDERNGEDQCSLVRWGQRCVKERRLDQMVDSNINGTVSPKCLRGFAQIADRCLRSILKERPTMAEVVVSLQALLELQQRYENSAETTGVTGFISKIHKYLVSATKQSTDQNGSSSSKSPENNKNQCSSTNNESSDHGERTYDQPEELSDTNLKWFAYYDLKHATKNFGNATCLSDKSYALVYKGWLDKTTYSPSEENIGLPFAVKRLDDYKRVHGISDKSYALVYKGWLDKTTYSPSEENIGLPIAVKRLDRYERVHRLDLEMLKEFRHPNLEKLIGYGLHGKQLFLVYEFMPNGNFEDLLHSGGVSRLPLVAKVKIAVGIARGIVFLHKTQAQVGADLYSVCSGTVGESRLDRHKILLDEDFTAKLSDYDVTKLVHNGYPRDSSIIFEIGYYYPGCHPLKRQSDIMGFTVLFAEVLTGEQLYYQSDLQKIDDLFIQYGKMSFVDIAHKCFEFCYEVDSESRMLRMLEQYIPASQYEKFTIEIFESYLTVKTGFTSYFLWYFLPATTQNADQNGTSSSKSTENNIDQCSPTKKDGSDHGEMPRQHEDLVVTHLKCFTYHELRHATKNFRNGRWLSDKRCMKVYKGWTYSEDNTALPTVIKRLDCYTRADSLDVEMLLKEFSHPNLVKLIGYCLQGRECKHPFLVYESLSKGNLDYLIHSGVVALLSLVTKVKIAVGIARGIVYLLKTHDQVGAYPSRNGTVSESRLDRKKILLDEDFTAKLSDYDVTMLVHGRCSQITRTSNKLHSSELHSNLSGFTVVFAEVLTGKQISNQNEFQKIDDLFTQHGKMSLVHIAKSCFEICNDVDSESKMLRILEEYEQYIPAYEFTTEAFESCLVEPAELPLAESVSLIEEVSRGSILLEPPKTPLVEKVSLIEGISRGPVLLEPAELPLVERVNLIEGVSRGHICSQDTVARESLLEIPG